MKKKWIVFPALALLVGCAREIDTNLNYIDGEFTLYATSGENETRTVLQKDGRVFWSPSDCITVFYGNIPGKFTSTNTEPAASAEFTGSLGSFVLDGETEFKAIYPHSDDIVIPGDNGILSIYLPPEQTAVEGTFADDLFICVAKSNDFNLHFYNVCGGVKFSLTRDDIKKVVFRGNDGEILAGRIGVEFGSDGKPVVAKTTAGRTSVTLEAPEGGTFKAGAYYYLVTIPKELSKGYTLDLYTDELVETITSDSSVSIYRSYWGVLKGLGTPSQPQEDPETIDLGLPSGLLWASCNLGASKPEEYGDYYAWGETEPYYEHGYAQSDEPVWKPDKASGYDWTSYKWSKGSYLGAVMPVTKYCLSPSYSYYHTADGKEILDPEDDAATVNLGGKWRTPSYAEIEELISNCTWKDTYVNGVRGQKGTGPNGNTIFFPLAGYRAGTTLGTGLGECWSSNIYRTSVHANIFYCTSSSSDVGYFYTAERWVGLTVRPVYGELTIFVPVESVSLNKTRLELSKGRTELLIATVNPDDSTVKTYSWSSSNEAVATVSSAGIVKGVSIGSAIITVTTDEGKKKATCNVTVTESSYSVATPGIVDLGLSVKWGTFNLGAMKPEDYGDYFAWGETDPKEEYSWNSYKWNWEVSGYSNEYNLTKYCGNPINGHYSFADGKTILDQDDDAAYVNLGGKWRMPTKDEYEELLSKCSLQWIWRDNVYGVECKGPNGRVIFLPAAGYRGNPGISYSDSYGFYWSSNLDDEEDGFYLSMPTNSSLSISPFGYRYFGYSIRPVYTGSTIPVTGVSISNSELDLSLGSSFTLTASVLPTNASDNSIFWESSNESIVTVSCNGVVTGMGEGTATITVYTNDGNKSAICRVTVVDRTTPFSPVTPEVVDLGLSVKWASFNLGATRPEEYGDYFAWGETEPYYLFQDPLIWKDGKESGYDWPSYKWCMGSENTFTKYCVNSRHGYDGISDGKTTLEPEDDAVRVHLGGKWRMPTKEELDELWEKCSWEDATVNGVNGRKLTGPNGRSIFLPKAGFRSSTYNNTIGRECYYWSSSLYTGNYHTDLAYYLDHYSGYAHFFYGHRFRGHSIRPVYDSSIHSGGNEGITPGDDINM